MLIVYVLRMKITQFDDLQQVFIEQSDLTTQLQVKTCYSHYHYQSSYLMLFETNPS